MKRKRGQIPEEDGHHDPPKTRSKNSGAARPKGRAAAGQDAALAYVKKHAIRVIDLEDPEDESQHPASLLSKKYTAEDDQSGTIGAMHVPQLPFTADVVSSPTYAIAPQVDVVHGNSDQFRQPHPMQYLHQQPQDLSQLSAAEQNARFSHFQQYNMYHPGWNQNHGNMTLPVSYPSTQLAWHRDTDLSAKSVVPLTNPSSVTMEDEDPRAPTNELPGGAPAAPPVQSVVLPSISSVQTSSRPSRDSTHQAAANTPEAEPQLCSEQEELLKIICSGQNVFYTGSAGCGKSTVLKAFVKRLSSKRIRIIAPTGRAALDINGSTSWTFAGWTPDHMKKPLAELKKLAHGKFVSKRMQETDLLVIDEISMMENHHFERLNAVMKEARGNERAFGGVQLVVTGDFAQLPPVKPFGFCLDCGRELAANIGGAVYTCPKHGEFHDIDKWAFRSAAWKECNFQHVNLTTIHRQSDPNFIHILQRCRLGHQLSPDQVNTLLNHESNTHNAVKLFSTREEVRRVNQEAFERLRSREYLFACFDDFRHNPAHANLAWKGNRNMRDNSLDALRDHRLETTVALKQGMLAVLQVNLDLSAGLVNGSQGVITGWEPYDPKKLPKALENSNLSRGERAGARETAQGPPILSGDYALIREDNISQFIKNAQHQHWPIVRFQNGVTKTIYAQCTVSELGDEKPYSLLSRTQIPLLPAWAMSVHKAQGMTLNRVIVDLARAFEEGQVYVALSRARSLEGLKVLSLGTLGSEGGNPQVREFLRQKFGI